MSNDTELNGNSNTLQLQINSEINSSPPFGNKFQSEMGKLMDEHMTGMEATRLKTYIENAEKMKTLVVHLENRLKTQQTNHNKDFNQLEDQLKDEKMRTAQLQAKVKTDQDLVTREANVRTREAQQALNDVRLGCETEKTTLLKGVFQTVFANTILREEVLKHTHTPVEGSPGNPQQGYNPTDGYVDSKTDTDVKKTAPEASITEIPDEKQPPAR